MKDGNLHHWRYEKILALEEASSRAAELKAAGKKLVTVNGSFDLLHAGHIELITEAKKQGDILFVGVNSDACIREGKGTRQPYISEDYRVAMIAALQCVNFVCLIDSPYQTTHDVLIRTIKPHVHVNSDFYGEPEEWLEWKTMQKEGVDGCKVIANKEFTTEKLLTKIRQ